MNIKKFFIIFLKKTIKKISSRMIYIKFIIPLSITINIKSANHSLIKKFDDHTQKILEAVGKLNEALEQDETSKENARKEALASGRASQNTLDRMFLKTTLEGEKNSNHETSRPTVIIIQEQ